MEIEELAVERPEALARVEVDPASGITLEKAKEIAIAGKFPAELVDKVAAVFVKLYEVYTGEDATLVEVNPLVLTGAGDIVALDGKVSLRRQRRVPPPGARGARGQGRGRPARGEGQGARPQLREARRRGRHHRQRRRAS